MHLKFTVKSLKRSMTYNMTDEQYNGQEQLDRNLVRPADAEASIDKLINKPEQQAKPRLSLEIPDPNGGYRSDNESQSRSNSFNLAVQRIEKRREEIKNTAQEKYLEPPSDDFDDDLINISHDSHLNQQTERMKVSRKVTINKQFSKS